MLTILKLFYIIFNFWQRIEQTIKKTWVYKFIKIKSLVLFSCRGYLNLNNKVPSENKTLIFFYYSNFKKDVMFLNLSNKRSFCWI